MQGRNKQDNDAFTAMMIMLQQQTSAIHVVAVEISEVTGADSEKP
jgi:hypothetical protein